MKILLVSFFLFTFMHATITQYKTEHFCFTPHGKSEKAVIRTLIQDGVKKQLIVDTQTLQTRLQPIVKVKEGPCGDSRYTRLLDQSTLSPTPLQNDGITHGKQGIALTTDLCPSSKQGFERKLYQRLIETLPHPVPVILFVTGRWIEKHPKAFTQFLTWGKEQQLSITWGNHTYSHPYHPKVPLVQNFALSPDYDLQEDTLRLEKMLIEKGVIPSVFFRFPGLVSDPKAIQTIHDLGLITIGSDTWIAKGQKVKKGSIILLHGNKNEPKGVKMFLEMLGHGEIERIDALEKVLP